MTPDRVRRIEKLYHAALERQLSERDVFLAAACQGDAELRKEIESLLEQQSGSLLDGPAWEQAPSLLGRRALAPGSQLGPYNLIGAVGSGGMGDVYRAHDPRMGRDVAIKVSNQRFSDRFSREVHAVAALNHPNICNVYDVGPDYLVMELVEGPTLAERIKEGPVPLDEALAIARQIAEALEAAHDKGIVHRDLKPANIMVRPDGVVKVLDFGLAIVRAGQIDPATSRETFTVQTEPGVVMGTLGYMSPEQLAGKDADARSDLFAFGAVLYEILTGQRAFQQKSPISTITADPKPLRDFVKGVPPELEHIILRCLRKRPEERYASATELERQLDECCALISPSSGVSFRRLFRNSKRPPVAIPALLMLLLLASLFAWWLQRSSKVRWARSQALPQIEQLIEKQKFAEAFTIALQAEKYISDDPAFAKLWPAMSWLASIHTIPEGASVFRRNYNAPDNAWEFVGRSPIDKMRVPLVESRWKFELKGFATVERATAALGATTAVGATAGLIGFLPPRGSLTVQMDEEDQAPAGMVHQTDGVRGYDFVSLQNTPATLIGLPGFGNQPAIQIKDYWIDRYEVTNKQFQSFVDHGGYRKPEYWKNGFRKDGHTLSWRDAMVLFRDRTGRPGPATWEQGEYPGGQEDFPVTGVSWYEAAAYAEFAGKSLPTVYHWSNAASGWFSASIVPRSNFGGQGPARVGSYGGMSWSGAYDMAGNVKEWCWNDTGSGKRYTMGGAWDEPAYMFPGADARSPFDRSANLGFRCAKYRSDDTIGKAADPVVKTARDYNREKPVSDELFRVYKSLCFYDKTPLHAVVEFVEETTDWKREKVTFDAAYGNERVIAYLFLPKKSRPPFQTVVFFPGAAAINLRSSANVKDFDEWGAIDFVIKSGRAVMHPVYKGTYERGDELKSAGLNTTISYRDHMIAASKDLGRSIDYLETRSEIDHNKVAYEGLSWGGMKGAYLPAVEDRIKVCVLIIAGFSLGKSLPEVDEINFAPHVKVPVLMLTPRFDFVFPLETSQLPMFRLLGTPKEHKRHVIYETGHNIPRNEMIKETLDWLDRYLGPVE